MIFFDWLMQPFRAGPSISIDYAVMEKTDRAVIVPAQFDWTDVGSWSTLWNLSEKDDGENVSVGDVLFEDASGCYLRGDGVLVAALGIEDLVVTATPDVVLVASKHRDQDVKKLVDRLKANGHRAATQTSCVHRPGDSTSRSMPASAFRSSELRSIRAASCLSRSTFIALSIGSSSTARHW